MSDLYDENESFDQAEYEQWLDECHSADDDERDAWSAACQQEYEYNEITAKLAGGAYDEPIAARMVA